MGDTRAPVAHRTNLKTLLQAYERQLILAALAAAAGNQRRAARALGLLPTTLHEKMKRLGIQTGRQRRDEDDVTSAGTDRQSLLHAS